MSTYDIAVNEGKGLVSFEFGIDKQDAEEFKRRKEETKRSALSNLENANRNVADWNSQLVGYIESIFKNHKGSLLKENDFFSAINLQVNKGAESLVSVPLIRKKIVPQPSVNSKQSFSTVSSVSEVQYQDPLKLLFDIGKLEETHEVKCIRIINKGLVPQVVLQQREGNRGRNITHRERIFAPPEAPSFQSLRDIEAELLVRASPPKIFLSPSV